MKAFIRVVTVLSNLCGAAAAVMVAATALLLCQLVFQRYGLEEYTAWQGELATYLMIAIAFVGAPYVLLTRGHIRVDIAPTRAGPRLRRGLEVFTAAFSLLFCLVLAWAGIGLWREAYVEGWTSDSAWGIKLWIPYLSLPFGIGVLVLQYIADLLCLVSGAEVPFPAGGDGEARAHGEKP